MKDNLRPMKELFKTLIKWIMFPVFLGMVWTGVYSIDVKYLGGSNAVLDASILCFCVAILCIIIYSGLNSDIVGVGVGGYCPGCENCEHHDECREFYGEYITKEKEKVDLEKDELKEVHNE